MLFVGMLNYCALIPSQYGSFKNLSCNVLRYLNYLTDPNLLPRLQVDKGAIKFILSGANIMVPGLTSPGARMDIVYRTCRHSCKCTGYN